ncbi:MAG: rhodanese-like domain-containing protein [Woeseia sp.]
MFEELSPTEFQERCASGELWQLLDVREPWELATASVPDAISIPMGDVTSRLDELDREQPVAVLCHSGGRSARVASLLTQSGFNRVANISGGIDAWSQQLDSQIPRY